MNRRKYLLYVGSTATLAGCSSTSGSSDRGDSETREGVEIHVEDVVPGVAVETSEQISPLGDSTEGFFQSGTRRLQPTPKGAVGLFIQIEAEVVGDQSSSLAVKPELAVVAGGSQSDIRTLRNVEFVHPVRGEGYEGPSDARPGVSASGWILATVPVESAKDAALSWQRGEKDAVEWELDVGDVPNLDVAGVEVPEAVERHSEAEIAVQVRNSGGRKGRFVDRASVTGLQEDKVLDVTVEPGSTSTASTTISQPMGGTGPVGSSTVEVAGQSETVEWAIPVRALGEPYELPNGLEVSVQEWRQLDRAALDTEWSREYESGDGEQLLFVRLSAVNGDDEPRSPMSANSLSLRGPDGSGLSTTLHHPLATDTEWAVPDVPVYLNDDLDPGEKTSGWALYGVTDSVDLSDCRLRWSRGPLVADYEVGEPNGIVAEWKLE